VAGLRWHGWQQKKKKYITDGLKIYLTAINYTTIIHSKALQNIPKVIGYSKQRCQIFLVTKYQNTKNISKMATKHTTWQ
jgi:hypothetical protein